MTTRIFTMAQDSPLFQSMISDLKQQIVEETDPNVLGKLARKLEMLTDSIITYRLYHCRCPDLRRGIHTQECLDKQQKYENDGWVPTGPLLTPEEIEKMIDDEFERRL